MAPAKRKKILHFIDSGGLYGAESVILNLSREMLDGKEYEPVIACIVQHQNVHNELFQKSLTLDIQAVKIVINNKRFFIDVPRAALLIKKMRVDLIHSHGYKPSVVGFAIHLLTGIPVTATCHLWYMGGKRLLKQRIMTLLESFFYRFFPKIIAVSKPIKKTLIQSGVCEDKITIIKNGIFIDDFYSEKSDIGALKNSLGLLKDYFVLINIARLTEQKAQKNIILAAKELDNKGVHAVFLIIGEGGLRQELNSVIAEYKLQNVVKLLGFRKDVKELLGLADAFILPSYDEGLPISMLEAMASGTPAIVTSVGDIPSLVRHGRSALIIPVDDVLAIVKAVEWMIEYPEGRRHIAEEAFSIVQRDYSSEVMYASYNRVYEEIMRHKSI